MTGTNDHGRDLETLAALGRLGTDPDFPEATPCIRMEFTADCPLSALPPGLDDVLARAFDMIAPGATFYGAETTQRGLGFPPAKGRRPKPADRASLAGITALMAGVQAAHRAELDQRMAGLRAIGLSPDPADFIDTDGGNLVLADAFPEHLAGNMIYLSGSTPWRVAISFSLPFYRDHAAEVAALAQALAATGAFDSGCYGFALNTGEMRAEVAEDLILPMTRRFPLLNPTNPRQMKLTAVDVDRDGDRRMLYPLGAWYFVSRRALARHGIDAAALHALAPAVHEVREHDHSFLIRLWDQPVLGDVNWQADLSPARAVTAALRQGFGNPLAGRAIGAAVGYEADRHRWYRRFLDGAA